MSRDHRKLTVFTMADGLVPAAQCRAGGSDMGDLDLDLDLDLGVDLDGDDDVDLDARVDD